MEFDCHVLVFLLYFLQPKHYLRKDFRPFKILPVENHQYLTK